MRFRNARRAPWPDAGFFCGLFRKGSFFQRIRKRAGGFCALPGGRRRRGSVFEALQRGRDAPAARNKGGRGILVNGHDGGRAKEPAKLKFCPLWLPDGGDDAHGGGLWN